MYRATSPRVASPQSLNLLGTPGMSLQPQSSLRLEARVCTPVRLAEDPGEPSPFVGSVGLSPSPNAAESPARLSLGGLVQEAMGGAIDLILTVTE